MKIILSLFFLLLSSLVAATDYYVKNGGDDQNTGISDEVAWATISKVNSVFSSLSPGDRILFKRGDVFYGTILISRSGSVGKPIILGAYGTGNLPVITGMTELTSWVNEGNGIYSSYLSSQTLTNMVLIDGQQYAMGRWPDNAYNIFESCSTNTTISDNDLNSDINWEGAEVVIRKNDWSLDRCKITAHTGTTISYVSMGTTQDAIAKHGYFIQNDIRTLTSFGEWYHDPNRNRIYIFFGTANPLYSKVEVATLKNLVQNGGMDYITFENLNLKGSFSNLIDCDNSLNDYITIQNCQLSFAGLDGINLWGHYCYVTNNLISSCNQTGIKITGNQHKITSNIIEKVGILDGQAMSGNLTNGLAINDNDCLIKNNIIRYIGYCGISLSSTADVIMIQNNYIHNVLLNLNDGGGIYVAREGISRTFDANIITDVIGNTSGTPYPTRHIARGIYLDVNSTNVIVTNNTVANCDEAGYMIHRAYDNKIENNTAFNNGYGMYYQNSLGSNIRNNSLRNNIFIAKDAKQLTLKFSSVADDIQLFGNADYNYYARPVDDDDAFHTYSPSTGSKYRTLADWQSFTSQDRNSKKSAVTVSDTSKIDFYFNPSTSNKVISLSQPMVDVTGKKYSGSVTLLPYTSVILMPDPNPSTPATPVFSGATVENSAPSVIVLNYNIALANILPATSAFTVKVNGTARSVSSVTVSGTKVLITLSSIVNYGEAITIAYSKPSGNPLQTSEGAQAASFGEQMVTNNCTAPTQPPVQPPTQPNQPPVISIASPVKGSSFTSPALVEIEVTATDPDGIIQSVALYNGSEKLGERTSAPFTFTLKNLKEGSYALHAVASDNLKASATSSTLEFHVVSPELPKGLLNIYPNPNDGNFSLDFTAPEGYDQIMVSVVNQNGNVIMHEELSRDQYLKQYDLSYLVPGIYIIMISADRILATHKFIKR